MASGSEDQRFIRFLRQVTAGFLMDTDTTRRRDDDRGVAQIHREILKIGVLILIAVAGFFVTRAVAGNSRYATLRDAEAWYARGQQAMNAGHIEEAMSSFRRASVRNRSDRRYGLALAQVLERSGDPEAARAALRALREASPEDAEVNLGLARLAALQQDVTEALRFYRNALYAPWPADSARERRDVRFELIDFLLQHDQPDRALSELLAMAADLPDDAAVRVRVAQLFTRAGDSRQALDQYERALRLSPSNGAALAGAGASAFARGDYLRARDYLARAPNDVDDVVRTREIVDLILSSDPLAARLGAAERRRRSSAWLDYANQRLQTCGHLEPAVSDGNAAATLEQEAADLQKQLKRTGSLDHDIIETVVDLLARVELHVANTCPPITTKDQALALIARKNATESK
jgi:tetratricopeptide (TPR) repeat protein